MSSSGMTSPGTRSDSLTTSSSYRVRSQSMSSDRPSTTGYGTMLSPPTVIEPEPVYIAASAASQIVTNDHDSHSEAWFDEHGIEPSGETAMVNPGALRLVNNFLDQLLFSFLAVSKSTSLASLRLAVGEVLKPKLAKEAVNLADQELDEYLGGGEEEELIAFHNGIEPNGDWDLELVWKRTRLRCMVYSSLGDMEEEDEDHYTELDQLDGPPGSTNRYSDQMGIVSPAVAIFLTSILEFMGEQALVAAGQAAYHRIRAKQQKDEREGTSTPKNVADRVVVEDADMERVALDRTLGRLWRGWKKRIRSPNVSISPGIRQSFSRESMRSRNHSRTGSGGNEQLVPEIHEVEHELSMDEVIDDLYAAKIPLPIGDDDVREIEIPGLAEHSDDEEELEKVEVSKARPKSMMIFTSNTKGLPMPTSSQPTTPALLSSNSRKRSYSLPSPAASTFASPLKKQKSTDAESAQPATESKDATHSRNASQISHKEGSVVGITAGAVTLGAAAAGIAAVEKEEVSQVTPATEEDIDLGEESDVEIMTSSRISIGDILALENARPPSSNSSIRSPSVRSKRSASVHSIRLIDVQSPRSPNPRHTSDDLATRPGLTKSISGGVSAPSSPDGTTPRVSSPVQRISTASPVIRNPSPLNREVRKNSGSSLAAVQPQEIPRSVPVPDRSPLRDVPASGYSSKDVLSGDEAQFAVIASETEDSAFVLATAPPPRSSRDMKKATVHNIVAAPASPPKISHIPTPVSVVPPLTPLREMMENALDTSDDGSSIAPSYSDAFGRPSDVSMGSSSAIGKHDPSIRSRTAASDRSITRSSPPRPQTQRDEDATPRPEMQNKESHRTRASDSSASSIKSHKLRPVRTSEDNSPSAGEDKGQSFEQLIRSETTLQYTLTPQSMRTIENVPDSPSHSKISRPRTGSNNSISKVAGLFSNSPAEIPRPIPSPTMSQATSKSGSRVRANAPMARDARVESESIGDFADFIRSTGPPKGRDDFAVGPPSTANSNTGSSRTANTSAPRSVPMIATLPKRSASSARRNRLQARDAVVHGDASSELIDFIRQGPPSSDNPRIPRTVAPFRSTMDSDQMSGALSGTRLATLPEIRDSLATNVSIEPSLHSSINTVNSGTALLSSHKKVAKAPPPQMYNAFEEEEDMMPKRKTRRVKDPYAIDFSDEEDEFDTPVAKPKPKRQEESLIDFLNSVAPPPAPVLTSIFDDVPKPAPKKKDSIMSRFSRGGSGSISQPQSPSVSKPSSSSGSRLGTRTGTPQVATHIPITTSQYSFEISSSGRPQTLPGSRAGNYASQVGDQRKPGARVVQKSYQPREATHVRATRTSDLADFFMNTPPPPTVTFTPPQPVKEEGGFAWMFGRKKKVAV